MMKRLIAGINLFRVPLIVLMGIVSYILLSNVFQQNTLALIIILAIILIGSLDLIKDTVESLLHGKFALDYIALLAIITGLLTQQYLVAAVIVLMLSGGNTLEDYGMIKAKQSLTALVDRIPHQVHLFTDGGIGENVANEEVKVGQEIYIRKGEVIPLDGRLVSDVAEIDESSLTGEPYADDKIKGDSIRSGTVNVGEPIVIEVTKPDSESTYRRIIQMVQQAQNERSPLIRLADRYSTMFTIVTLLLAGLAYLISHDPQRILAVLVIATPCPLILATPIALMGGVNSAARKRIIVKGLASIEVLARVQALILDKTGTITLGRPRVQDIVIEDPAYDRSEVLAIAAAIERSSLHPLAKAIIETARKEKVLNLKADQVQEVIGHGISAVVNGKAYTISKLETQTGMSTQLSAGDKRIAQFQFEDEIKQDSFKVIRNLRQKLGIKLFIYTGDKQDRAEEVVKLLGTDIEIKAECTPEDKRNGIKQLKEAGLVTGMVGDGINDAPALALADVGLVFSNEEQTASSEAADIVFLTGDLTNLNEAISISRRTIDIALQSIKVGIGISIVGMLFASFGFIVPIVGAFIQEAIDVAVILNALRASRIND